MPTYEYLCRACGERLEVVQSFADSALTTCGACGGELRKVFSAAGLIFKGSGWHVKDYASSGSSAPASAAAPASGTSETASSTGTTTGATPKPETAAKPAPAATPASSSTGD
jgi:putative FmdB family regulatory protein